MSIVAVSITSSATVTHFAITVSCSLKEDGKRDDFPAMGYLHIDGRGMKPNGGSRYNPLEAETIAAWLVAHKDDIERHYGEPLYKVVGVVTPFSAQVNAIKTSLRKLEINGKDEQGSLTVGTVHPCRGGKGDCSLFSCLLKT